MALLWPTWALLKENEEGEADEDDEPSRRLIPILMEPR
jgi:hypothetical protein